MAAEAMAYHHADLRERWDEYFARTRELVAWGVLTSAADYVQAQRVRRKLRDAMHSGFAGVDALLAPMTATTAPDAEQAVSSYQKFFYLERPVPATAGTLLGLPSISQCCGFAGDGMPIAMQLLAEPGADSLVMRIAHAYEQATPWRGRLPVA
jgi:Asp-tRNA(Asn)/Glu-tRNA(Gln) amidotransferase A subunit family amidase